MILQPHNYTHSSSSPGHFWLLSPRAVCVRIRTYARYSEVAHVVLRTVFHKLYRCFVPLEQALGELRSVELMPHRARL